MEILECTHKKESPMNFKKKRREYTTFVGWRIYWSKYVVTPKEERMLKHVRYQWAREYN